MNSSVFRKITKNPHYLDLRAAPCSVGYHVRRQNLIKTVLRADCYCTSNCDNFFAFWSYVNPWKLVRNGHSNLTFHWWLFACVEYARQQAVLRMDTPKIADSSRLVVGTAISYFRWFVQKTHQLSVTTWSSTSGPFSKVSYTIKVDSVKF